MEKDKLYYDDTCPICSAEMSKLARHHTNSLELVPLTSLPEEEAAPLYTELHVKTGDGQWVTGLEANVRAWQHTKYRKLASLLLHPSVRWASTLGYKAWLSWYRWQRKRRINKA